MCKKIYLALLSGNLTVDFDFNFEKSTEVKERVYLLDSFSKSKKAPDEILNLSRN